MRRAFVVLAVAAALTGCSANKPAPAASAPAGAAPKPSPSDAVSTLLTAEKAGDHDASFRLLDGTARKDYKDVADWRRRRAELSPITSFTITNSTGSRVTAMVTHQPGLDAFIGLSPAHERQVWTAHQVKGGWLVDGDPIADPVLPPDAAATTAVRMWAEAVQRCDQSGARQLQAGTDLFGAADAAGTLCHSTGAVTTGGIGRLPAGPASADIVAQYTSDALQWTRTVAITGPTRSFRVVVAPIGDDWRVIGLTN